MLPMRPKRAQSTQAGTADTGIPRIRYAVPTLNHNILWLVPGELQHLVVLTDPQVGKNLCGPPHRAIWRPCRLAIPTPSALRRLGPRLGFGHATASRISFQCLTNPR